MGSEEKQQQQLEDQLDDESSDHQEATNNSNNNNNDDVDDDDAVFEQPEETNTEPDQDLGETDPRQEDVEDELPVNSPSTPPRSSPSSPQLIPKLEQPSTPPSEAEPEPSPCPSPSPCPPTTPKLPKLRCNALLASDPALKPDAKELTLLAPPPLSLSIKPEAPPQAESLGEPLMKPARFMCLPCGIAFSSPSTLEAHQAYYCSHRNKETEEDQAGSDKSGAGGGAGSAGAAGAGGAGSSGGSSEPPAKMARTGKQYACSQCSYSADKKVSLNRHMRMHQTSPAAPTLVSLPSLIQNGIPPPGVTPNALEEGSSQVSKVLLVPPATRNSSRLTLIPIPPSSRRIATAATVISASTTSRRTGRTSSTTAAPGDPTASSPQAGHLSWRPRGRRRRTGAGLLLLGLGRSRCCLAVSGSRQAESAAGQEQQDANARHGRLGACGSGSSGGSSSGRFSPGAAPSSAVLPGPAHAPDHHCALLADTGGQLHPGTTVSNILS